jgi:hypothetical protein
VWVVVDATDYVIFLNGAYGIGKSSVLDHLGNLLAEAGHPFSLMSNREPAPGPFLAFLLVG